MEYLTVYAFSTENWKRPADEVSAIMGLLKQYLLEAMDTMERDHIRLQLLRGHDALSPELQALARGDATRSPSTIDGLSGQHLPELRRPGRDPAGGPALCRRLRSRGADARRSWTEELFSGYLYSAGIPDPELIIRPSGELRLRNFLLWQCAYAEFYFCRCAVAGLRPGRSWTRPSSPISSGTAGSAA